MVAVRITPFGGMIPAVDDGLLPDTHAAYALNTWVYKGTVKGLPELKFLRALDNPNAEKVFRIPKSTPDAAYLIDSYWLEFGNANTDVIRSQVVGDTHERYYWAGVGTVPSYNTLARIANGDPAFILGVPQHSGLTVVPSGGASATLVSRAYVATWVTAYGEEGPPSDPYLVTGKIDDTFDVTLTAAAPDDLGIDRNITLTRIYRTVTALTGVTTYFLVAELPVATLVYADTLSDAVVSGQSPLESTNWSGPPSDLEGFVTMSNGIVAAWRKNEIWFCEPYRMHAWPVLYVLVVEFDIVGMGVSNQTLVVATQGYPHVVTGINPASMSVTKQAGLLPCTSRDSIVSSVEGVYFATPQGLALVSSGGVSVVTKELIRKDKWVELVPLPTLRAVKLGQAYYGFGSVRTGAFDVGGFDTDAFAQEDFSGSRRGILIDPTSRDVAFNLLSSEDPITNIILDAWSGETLVLKDGEVFWLDISDTQQMLEPYTWKSKVFQAGMQINMQAAKVFFNVPPATPSLNPVPNEDPIQTLADDQYGLLRVYAGKGQQQEMELIMTREIRKNGELMRLPSGFKSDYWQFEIEGRIELTGFQAATTSKELRQV